jgi:hypothetical protein
MTRSKPPTIDKVVHSMASKPIAISMKKEKELSAMSTNARLKSLLHNYVNVLDVA